MRGYRGRGNEYPLVVGEVLPADEHDPAIGTQRRLQIRECSDGVVEEHDPEPADDDVVEIGLEGRSLRVGDLEPGVLKFLLTGPVACAGDHGFGDVDAEHIPRSDRRRERRGPGSAANVEHAFSGTDLGRAEEPPHVRLEHRVVSPLVLDPMARLVGVPKLDLVAVRVRHDRPPPAASSLRRVTTFHVRTVAGVPRPPWKRAVFIFEAATPCGYRR